jgi:adenylosuccinate synthase
MDISSMTPKERSSDTRYVAWTLLRSHLTLREQALAERLKPYIIDSIAYIHSAMKSGKKVLVEGANALMLDLDLGTYPYVTSSPTSIGGVCTGLGIPPKMIGTSIGVMKAYTTRVGGGPFPTEQLNVGFCLPGRFETNLSLRTPAFICKRSGENTEPRLDAADVAAG